ncbi:hypothetical protein OIO90_006482 [Microbotryomycetes sp. JL221]|nr:hypothetical protein OIO90_006482 [Microbotryomycetes sp. JL221]
MASSAALMQGFQSFNNTRDGLDSSTNEQYGYAQDDSDVLQGHQRKSKRAQEDEGQAGEVGMTTVGGITFGTVMTSFDADDEDERRLDNQYRQQQASKGTTAAPMAWYRPNEAGRDSNQQQDNDRDLQRQRPSSRQQQQHQQQREPRIESARSVTNSTTATTRIASNSTAPTSTNEEGDSNDQYDQDVIGYGQARRATRAQQAAEATSTRAYDRRQLGHNNKKQAFVASGVRPDWHQPDENESSIATVDNSRVDLKGLNANRTVDDSLASVVYGGGARNGVKKSPGGVGQNMTLREQEKVIDEFKKENFDLKLKIHFYEQRLEKLAPEHVDQALRENIQLKVEFQTLRTELKRYKKLLLEGNKAIEQLSKDREDALRRGGPGSRRDRSIEKELQREKEDRETLEARLREQARELRELRETRRRGFGSHPEEEAEDEFDRLQVELEAVRDAHEEALGDQDDLRNQLRDTQDALDQARDEIARLGQDREDRDDLSSVVDGSRVRGREVDRLRERLLELEQENDALRTDLDELENQRGTRGIARSERSLNSTHTDAKTREELEEENDEYRDRAAAHALQVEKLETELAEKEREIEDLLTELDRKDADHVVALQQLEEDIKGEMEDARAREADVRDMLDERELDIEGLATKVETLVAELTDKENEMATDKDEIEALTHDLQKLGAQIFALEEEADEKDAKIQQLEAELEAADRELEDKAHAHEQESIAIRDQLAAAQAHLQALKADHASASSNERALRDRLDELTMKSADLQEKSKADTDTKQKLEEEAVEIMRALKKEEEEHERHRRESSQRRTEDEARWRKLLEERTKASAHANDMQSELTLTLLLFDNDRSSSELRATSSGSRT